MSEKLTAKQEAFAIAYAETGNASEAYRRAYDASRTKPDVVNVKASQLLANGKIRVRIEELSGKARVIREEKFAITIESITQMLLEDRELAKTCQQAGAAVTASKTIAQLHGIFVDRKENTNLNYDLGVLMDEIDGADGRIPNRLN